MQYLDNDTVSELKNALKKERGRLEGELSSFAHKRDEVAGDWETDYEDVGDDVDENAFEVEEYSNNRAVEHELELRLKEVNQALERIETNTYGFCAENNEPISVERLRANPATTRCRKHTK